MNANSSMGQNLDGAGKGPGAAGESDSQASSMSCDFCGAEVAHVRRIALDEGYDRLHARHVAKYACPDCSEVKERERLGG